jgi:hypothetical protein
VTGETGVAKAVGGAAATLRKAPAKSVQARGASARNSGNNAAATGRTSTARKAGNAARVSGAAKTSATNAGRVSGAAVRKAGAGNRRTAKEAGATTA